MFHFLLSRESFNFDDTTQTTTYYSSSPSIQTHYQIIHVSFLNLNKLVENEIELIRNK